VQGEAASQKSHESLKDDESENAIKP